jgi:DNA-binding response OmpR family regulator
VDDEPRYLRLLETNLQTEATGLYVRITQALGLFSSHPLTWCSMSMPRMDGTRLPAHSSLFNVPIMMLHQGEEQDHVKGWIWRRRCQVKPFSATELQQ